MPQVIYAWNYLQWGGAQTYYLSLIRTVREHFEVVMVLPEGSNEQLLAFINDEGVRAEFFSPSFDGRPERGIFRKIGSRVRKFKSELAMLRKLGEFDLADSIVHVDMSPWSSLPALAWLSTRTNVFITMHNAILVENPVRKFLMKAKLRTISRFRRFNVFASNQHTREHFKGLYSDDLYNRIKVTYTNVTISEVEQVMQTRPDRNEIREQYGLSTEGFLVFCVGQFIDRKGRWDLLEAARQTLRSDDSIKFVWIANIAPSEEDRRSVEAYALGDSFSLITGDRLGDKHVELMRLLSSADLFALPSYIEGLPIALLEAMALGIPSISTNVYAIPEAIRDRETGILIKPGDPEGLSAAVLELKRDDELRGRLGRNGMSHVTARFTDRIVGPVALAGYLEASRG